jgi:hypothetical protein
MATTRFGAISTARLDNLAATTNPTVNDDSGDGYDTFSIWINTVTDDAFMCVDPTVTAAVWQQLTGTSFGGSGVDNGFQSIPTFFSPGFPGDSSNQALSTTTARVGLFEIPADMNVARVSISVQAAGAAGATVTVAIYSMDGQTKYIDVQVPAASTSAASSTVTLTPVFLDAGYYYILVCRGDANGGTNPSVHCHNTIAATDYPSDGPVAGLVDAMGTLTVTAGAAPSTFDPTTLTVAASCHVACRLDST